MDNHLLTFAEASKLTGKSRQTFYKYAKNGKFTPDIGGDGVKRIDRSDLIRLGWLTNTPVSTVDSKPVDRSEQPLTDDSTSDPTNLNQRIAELESRLADKDKEIEWLRDQFDRVQIKLLNAPVPGKRKSWICRLFD